MALVKMVNGISVALTLQEEADFNASLVPELPRAKAALLAAILARRTAVERAGAASGGRTIRVDAETLVRLAALQAAATPGQQVPVELVDGSVVNVPSAALAGLITAAQARMLAAAVVEAAKRAEVGALGTLAAVQAYDVNAGWPA